VGTGSLASSIKRGCRRVEDTGLRVINPEGLKQKSLSPLEGVGTVGDVLSKMLSNAPRDEKGDWFMNRELTESGEVRNESIKIVGESTERVADEICESKKLGCARGEKFSNQN
jgi:hypothetical protein